MEKFIEIKGAREHNLKNISVSLPRDRLIVITGLSGSGKSSLAFDTIYAEGQRRYVESLSAYARQFLQLMEKPDVDTITGLSPAISIEQKTTSKNPRSTVGTVTEIHDYLRLLFARVGIPHCPKCNRKIARQSSDQIVDSLFSSFAGQKIEVLAPVVRDRKGEYYKLVETAGKQGFARARIDKVYKSTGKKFVLDKNLKHSIELLVDTVKVSADNRKRLAEAVESAVAQAEGNVLVIAKGKEHFFSNALACVHCGISLEELTPRMFSFNSPHGACSTCQGLGTLMRIDPELVLPDKTLSIRDGAIKPWSTSFQGYYMRMVENVGQRYGFTIDQPVKSLTKEQLHILLYGSEDKLKFEFTSKDNTGLYRYESRFEGVINNLERRYKETDSEEQRERIQRFMGEENCPACGGKKLKPEILAVTVKDKSIYDISAMSITEAKAFFEKISLDEKEKIIARQILKEINSRLNFLVDVGIGYLTLERRSSTLSGGEAQRIQLATQIGSALMGVMYILDEPSIGLHQRDNQKLIATLKRLRDLGNTVIVVEHDKETMENADYIVDLGPAAGAGGGHVVFAGTYDEMLRAESSLTGKYLSGALEIPVPKERRKAGQRVLEVRGAHENNLKRIDVKIPVGLFVCITGVSGSGKSTLIDQTLHRALARSYYGSSEKPGAHKEISGIEHFDKVINIDQSPIGRTPRSNPATYTGVFSEIRDLFAMLKESKARGYQPGRFSFNVKGGRCEACSGDGMIKIEMHFLPDVYVPCEVCKGTRYSRETLDVKYKGKSIADVLKMTIDEALPFFESIPAIKGKLALLSEVGLGYLELGQPAVTLSGGEAQRIKLTRELSKINTGKTLYILDEPTTGLHFADIKKLIGVLNSLVDKGSTVIVVEHNLDVIKSADHIIDLGPEGGDKGGRVIACGTPEEVAISEKSYTGHYLKGILNAGKGNGAQGKAEGTS